LSYRQRVRDTLPRLPHRLIGRWHHRTLGELYLLVTSAGALAFGVTLLWAPHSRTSGPSLVTLYSLAPRSTWGAVFLGLAALALFAAWRPTDERLIVVISIEAFAQAIWAIGLGVSNILAPIAWLQLASGALVVITSGRRPVLPPPARGRRRTDQER
jgi:hypothetical protein